MDPRAVLGVSADADEEAIAGAYRKLAKRFHPDHRPGDEAAAARMADINTAYALLRDSQAEMLARRAPEPRRRAPGSWLTPEVRRALCAELLRALEPDEAVLVVTDAATWDSLRVRLAVSDRRLLWLRDDAPTDRVRYLRWRAIASVEGRLRRPRRRVGELRVQPRTGRRVSFSELDPGALRLVLVGARRHVPA
ncbi:MAG: J domain-containing protein [Solirubrobacteraceae bacterium]